MTLEEMKNKVYALIEEYFMSKDKQNCFNEWGEWY